MHPAFVLLVMEHQNRVTYLRNATIGTDTLLNFSDTIYFQQHHFVKKAEFDIGQNGSGYLNTFVGGHSSCIGRNSFGSE